MKDNKDGEKKVKPDVVDVTIDATVPVSKRDTGAKKSSAKEKKNTSLRLDKQTLKALKIKAIENETSVQKLIESLVQEYLERDA